MCLSSEKLAKFSLKMSCAVEPFFFLKVQTVLHLVVPLLREKISESRHVGVEEFKHYVCV